MTARATLEHVARTLYRRNGGGAALPPNSEMDDADRAALAPFFDRADAALKAVRCPLMGAQCTCWTLEAVVAADAQSMRAAA